MNKEELLKQIEEAKNQIAKLQSDLDKMQNVINTIDDKDKNKPEFWLPKGDEKYYFIDASLGYSCKPVDTISEDDTIDFLNVMLNNAFRTEEECEIEIELLKLFAEIKEKALQEDELVPKNKIFDADTYKYSIKYDYSEQKLCCCKFVVLYHQGLIPNCFFKTSEFTRKIIGEYGERIEAALNKKYRGVNNDEI